MEERFKVRCEVLRNIVLAVKHGGGSIILWADLLPGELNGIIKNLGIDQNNHKLLARYSKLGHIWVFQQDSDVNHTSKLAVEWKKKANIKLNISPELNTPFYSRGGGG